MNKKLLLEASSYKIDGSYYVEYGVEELIKFFRYENKNYLFYKWNDEIKNCNLYSFNDMIFELKDDVEIPKEDDLFYFGENFVNAINYLVDKECINNYYAIKNFLYEKSPVILDGSEAKKIFNSLYKKYCKKEIPLTL